MEIDKLIRPNIRDLQPYSCARDEYNGGQAVFLDANESPFETEYNRYPDPYQCELKTMISGVKKVAAENIMLGNGSDEIIDLLIRTVCEPAVDNVIVFSPGYSMYEVSAGINHIAVRKINLTMEFLPDWIEMWQQIDLHTKIVFLCSPNNPTGRLIPLGQIEEVCRRFEGLVLVDEAYIDFTEEASAVSLLERFPNIVVLQTFSKAWGMAGLRLGLCIGDKRLVHILNKVKAPYNISSLTQRIALEGLLNYNGFLIKVAYIKMERERLISELRMLGLFERVYDSAANFILVTYAYCWELYCYLIDHGIVVRLRDIPPLINGGIRITVGTEQENDRLIEVLREYRRKEVRI